MAEPTILINLTRCTGCWTCSMACKVGNDLPDDVWWQTVRTLGSGEGIDRPKGSWPDLSMSWMPVHSKECVLCAGRTADGELPYCVASCPCEAMFYGDASDPESNVSKKTEELRSRGYKIFALPKWEGSREGIVYARREK